MNCPKCDHELLIDRVDNNGMYWYACINPRCPDYRKAFQPSTGAENEATIKPRTIEVIDTTPGTVPNITDDAE